MPTGKATKLVVLKRNIVGILESQAIATTLDGLLGSIEPAESIAAIIRKGRRTDSSAFEQYAATVLGGAGGMKLRTFKCSPTLKILAPENGRLAQLIATGAMPQSHQSTILAVECAINRLICIADALIDGIREDEEVNGPTRMRPGYRSAQVTLPSLPHPDRISQAFYNEIDWRFTDSVASNSLAVFQQSLKPNPYRSVFGFRIKAQSDWDVRTRLAQILNGLELPFRYGFRFDYNDTTESVAVLFTTPPVDALPPLADEWAPLKSAPSLERAYESYLLRLACLFGAAAFGCGRNVEHATIAGYDIAWKEPLVSIQFARNDFVESVLAAINSHTLTSPSLRFEPAALVELIRATSIEYPHTPAHKSISPHPLDKALTRIDPWLDARPLTSEARDLFHCERVCDVDTARYIGGHSDAIDLARIDSDESTLAAVMRLEALVKQLEAETQPPDDNASLRPLFADHPLSRLAIGLLDDDRSISEEAEAFLKGGDAKGPGTCQPLYFRAPSALYYAQFGLSDLYQRMGDLKGAEQLADRCIALAPTTAGAYFRKADVLAEQGLLEQAINILITGLHYSVVPCDCALLYYHLGQLLWNKGLRDASAAIHAYNASLQGEYAQKSRDAIRGMRKNADAPMLAKASPNVAARELKHMKLPVAPINLNKQIAEATVFLTNSGSPSAAAPYSRELEHICNNDETIVAACRSIYAGITLPQGE